MGDEDSTEAFLYLCQPDDFPNPIGQIHNLFPVAGADSQSLPLVNSSLLQFVYRSALTEKDHMCHSSWHEIVVTIGECLLRQCISTYRMVI